MSLPDNNICFVASAYSDSYELGNLPQVKKDNHYIVEFHFLKCMCGSINISKIGTLNRVASIAGFGILSKKIGKQWQCNNPECKYLW